MGTKSFLYCNYRFNCLKNVSTANTGCSLVQAVIVTENKIGRHARWSYHYHLLKFTCIIQGTVQNGGSISVVLCILLKFSYICTHIYLYVGGGGECVWGECVGCWGVWGVTESERVDIPLFFNSYSWFCFVLFFVLFHFLFRFVFNFYFWKQPN